MNNSDNNNYLSDRLSANTRILSVDVLRGLALFGILFAHMIFWYAGGPLPQTFYQTYTDIPSGITLAVYMLLVNSKFYAVFSFLFGLSFYIQITSLAKHQQSPALRFAWRLLLLGIIGLIHHAIWRGDILSIYAPLGVVLLMMRNLSDKALLIVAAAFVLNLPTKIFEMISIVTRGTPDLFVDTFVIDGKRYLATMSTQSFNQVLIDNLYAMADKYRYQITSGRLFITPGFFLLGMLAGRRRWFADADKHLDSFRLVAKQAGKLFVVVALVFIALGLSLQLAEMDIKQYPWLRWLFGSLMDLYNTSLTVIYICWVPLLMQKPKWHKRLAVLAPMGKMALTAYLTQTLFGVSLFFSVGFGLLLDTSPALNILLAIIVFSLQIWFCRLWLTHYQYGPVEWLWRSATYLRWQPLRKSASLPSASLQAE